MSSEKLIETFVQGELFISDWSRDEGANIKVIRLILVHNISSYILRSQFTLGPASKKPLHVALTELTPVECIEYTTSILMDVCLASTTDLFINYTLLADSSPGKSVPEM